MTQHELILTYCKYYGKIIPAKLKEADRVMAEGYLGSETIRRCQELVERKKLHRWPNEGKFAVYGLKPAPASFENCTPFVKEFLTREWVKSVKAPQQTNQLF